MVKNAKLLWAVVGVIAASGPVGASMLPAGGYVAAPIDTLSAVPAGTVLADTGVKPFVGTNSLLSYIPFTGTYESWVLKDASTGTLDFIYQVTNSTTSHDELHRLTMIDFAGFQTDVYSLTSSVRQPISINRADDAVVGIQYDQQKGDGITRGGTVEIVIKTNAQSYTQGSLSVIDGGTANVTAFAPTNPTSTPAPGLAVMLTTGLLSVLGSRCLRRGKLVGA